jgi:hypothetical protein
MGTLRDIPPVIIYESALKVLLVESATSSSRSSFDGADIKRTCELRDDRHFLEESTEVVNVVD